MITKMKGSVTIYLSIILVCILTLVSVVSESARVNVIQAESKNFTVMAGESVLAGYAKQILNDYGILLVWENQPVEEQVKTLVQANINLADLEGEGTNFMNTDLEEVVANSKQYVTENGGTAFVNQILNYMTYGGAIEAVSTLIGEMDKMENHQEYELGSGDAIDVVDEKDDKVQELVKDVYAEIDSLKKTERLDTLSGEAQEYRQQMKEAQSTSSEVFKESVSGFHDTSKKIEVLLDKKEKRIEKAMSTIEKYVKEKEQILEKTGYAFEGRDSVEDNRIVLKNVKDKIEENKKLSVLKLSGKSKEDRNTFALYVSNINNISMQLKTLKSNGTVTKKDEENKSLYKKAKALLTDGVLSLVTDDVSKLSANTISHSGLPSEKENKKENALIKTMENKALMALYASSMFGNYTKEKPETALKYEMEYILNGKDNDKDNLLGTVERLTGMRNILNAVYLLTDTQKMSLIRTTALSAATALAMPFLEPIIQAVLIEAWALAEAVSDVRALLRGKKVAVIKTKASWHTDLKSLSASENDYDQKGLTYLNYCQIMMLAGDYHDIVFRIMDLMQLNIQKRYQPSFQMAHCVASVDITAVYRIKPMFTALPWCVAAFSNDRQAYRYEVSYQNQY